MNAFQIYCERSKLRGLPNSCECRQAAMSSLCSDHHSRSVAAAAPGAEPAAKTTTVLLRRAAARASSLAPALPPLQGQLVAPDETKLRVIDRAMQHTLSGVRILLHIARLGPSPYARAPGQQRRREQRKRQHPTEGESQARSAGISQPHAMSHLARRLPTNSSPAPGACKFLSRSCDQVCACANACHTPEIGTVRHKLTCIQTRIRMRIRIHMRRYACPRPCPCT